jgi:hypothetical protein
VLDGVLTRNEARAMEGYNPIDGLDEPLVPTNEQTLSESNEPDDPVPPAGVVSPAKEQPAEEGADARLATVLRGNAARMARRINAGDPPEANVLASALAIPLPAAVAALATLAEGQQPAAFVTEYLLTVALKGTP